jgi:hypothetical protein
MGVGRPDNADSTSPATATSPINANPRQRLGSGSPRRRARAMPRTEATNVANIGMLPIRSALVHSPAVPDYPLVRRPINSRCFEKRRDAQMKIRRMVWDRWASKEMSCS